MAIQSTSLPTEQQDSMFEDSTLFAGSDEPIFDSPEESIYEPADDFSEEAETAHSHGSPELQEPRALEPEHAPEHVAAHTRQVSVSIAEPAPVAAAPAEAAPAPGHSVAGVPPSQSETHAEPAELTALTVDDFAALEERVFRAVNLVRTERQARIDAEKRAADLEAQLSAQLHAQKPIIEQLQQEVESLRAEREQVRQRVERLLSQLDALEL